MSRMGKITKYLNQLIVGNVFDDPEILERYAIDRSALKIKPKFVALPESTDDIRKLMRFFNQIAAREIPVSVTPRGSGLDESGADLSSGLIISTEKLNHLLEIDTRERLVRVQAGITLKELNTALSVSGLTIPIGGHERETIGGLIANAPVDSYADKYGGIQNYVERIEVILANGECLQTVRLRKYALAKKATEKSLEGEIYRKMAKLLKTKEKFIQEFDVQKMGLTGYPNITKVSKRETLDLMPLFFGSQGTLGIISEVILKAVPLKEKTMRVMATFRKLSDTITFMDKAKQLKPREMNLYDLKIIQEARSTGKNLDGVIRKMDDGFVVSMAFDERRNSTLRKLNRMRSEMPRAAKILFDTPENQLALREFDNSLACYLSHTKDGERMPILTDFYLPAVNLENFMKDLKVLGEKLKLDLALYGSYSTGIYSLRPRFEFETENLNKKIATFLRAGAYVINRQGGVLTGGTPEGRLKAVVTNDEMLDAAKDAYGEIKKIFDSNNILNPDVKLGAESRFTLTHLRDKELPILVGQ
ncbi:FAD-binding oxidoreductase [Candidatus Saccharibacteria bacterium]|nr:FAD-binding oxidoreductase [Candidatus Saccharibacteria bacterium]